MKQQKELVIIDSDLVATDAIIIQLDDVIQSIGNLELSKQLNEISDCFETIKRLMKKNQPLEDSAVNQ